MNKGDVGMAKHFSRKYGNKGWAFDYTVSAIWNKFLLCPDPCQYRMLHPFNTAWEQTAKLNAFRSNDPAKGVFNIMDTWLILAYD